MGPKKKIQNIEKQLKENTKLEKENVKLEKQKIKENIKLEKENIKLGKENIKLEKIRLKKDEEDKKNELQLTENIERLTIAQQIIANIEKLSLNANYKPNLQIIKSSITNIIISQIIHIADIHIKLISLHDEYNAIFELFYEDLKKIKLINQNCIICLCGDLLDSKDELKPDTIIHTWNFLKNMALIFPLIIISGNHDRIEQNDNKIDSIEAILCDRPIDNIYYLKNTGVYIYNNIIFGINSIVDKYNLHIDETNQIVANLYPEIYDKYVLNDIKKICLYHGTVCGSTTNENFLLNNSKNSNKKYKSLNDFGNYDYILLGDIHKFQYLNEKKTIAYSSSMISQNITETDIFHGFLDWNIITGESNYKILHNINAHHSLNLSEYLNNSNNTILIMNTVETDNLLNLSNISSNETINKSKINYKLLDDKLSLIEGGKLKININDSYNNIYKKELESYIKSKCPNLILDIRISYENISLKNQIYLKDENSLRIGNKEMNKMINNYLKDNEPLIADNEILIITEYFKQTIQKMNVKDHIETINNWRILELSFDSMYGYGLNNIIDFTQYPRNEIIGLFGKNAVGKSSLIDIITFMLYSRAARSESNTLPKDIININKVKSCGTLILEVNNIKYMIKKICYRNKNTIEQSMELYKLLNNDNKDNENVYIYNNEQYNLVSLTEKDRYKTTAILTDMIGDYETFITTSVLLQRNIRSFYDMSPKDKKKILYKILDIDYFSDYVQPITKLCSEINNEIKQINGEINGTTKLSISNINELIIKKKDLLPDLNQKYKNITETLIVLNDKKDNSTRELIRIDTNLIIQNDNDLIKKTNLLNKITTKQSEILLDINLLNDQIIKLNLQIQNLICIKQSEYIVSQYKNQLEQFQLEEKQLNDLLIEKQLLKQSCKIIKINPLETLEKLNILLIENTIKKDNFDIELSKLKLEHKKYNNLIINLTLLKRKEQIINNNQQYQQNQKLLQSNLIEESKLILSKKNKLLVELNIINSDISLEQHINELTILNQYIDINTVINKNKIILNYEKFITSQKNLVFELLDELKIKDYEENDNNNILNIIIDTLHTLLNPEQNTNKKNIIIEQYEKLIDIENHIKKRDIINEIINQIQQNKEIFAQIEILDKQIETLDKQIDDIKNQLLNILEFDNLYKEQNLELSYSKELIKIGDKINKINQNKVNTNSKINQLNENINIIKTNNLVQININNYIIEIKNININIETLKQNNNKSNINKAYLQLENELKTKITYDDKVILLKQKIVNLNLNIEENSKQINLTNNEINTYNNLKQSIILNNEINSSINIISREINELLIEKEKLNNEIKLIENEINKYDIILNTLNILTTNLKEKQVQFKMNNIIKNMVGVNGLQLYLLNEYLDKIAKKINNIVEPFINKTFDFEMDLTDDDNNNLNKKAISKIQIFTNSTNSSKSSNAKININIKQNGHNIYTLSGMECFMLDLSFIIIMNEIMEKPKSNIMFIDESISVLDKDKLNNINELFIFLKHYFYQVIMITHLSQVKNKIEYYLEIYKNEKTGYSLIHNQNINDNNNNNINLNDNINTIKISKKK